MVTVRVAAPPGASSANSMTTTAPAKVSAIERRVTSREKSNSGP
jgi:hypothetical protein